MLRQMYKFSLGNVTVNLLYVQKKSALYVLENRP